MSWLGGVRFRKRIRVFPGVYLNASRGGLSWSVKIGPWSYNSRTKAQRVDLPGGLYYQGRRK